MASLASSTLNPMSTNSATTKSFCSLALFEALLLCRTVRWDSASEVCDSIEGDATDFEADLLSWKNR